MATLFDDDTLAGAWLVVDQTGVGKHVIDLLRHSGVCAEIRKVTITLGHQSSWDEHGGMLVPKKDLVSVLQVLLQGQRLKVAPSLNQAALLVAELQQFRMKLPALTDDERLAWREGMHDDLVLAVAIAAWEGEKHRPVTEADLPMVLGERRRGAWW